MHHTEFVSLLRAGDEIGHRAFAERIVRALRAGMAVLDALPCDDPFWRGWGNDRVTMFTLAAYATARLERDPADRTAWSLVALALAHGDNDGGLPLLGPEIAADASVTSGALVIADRIAQHIGFDLSFELREVCAQADRGALEALAGTVGGSAARRALHVLDGQGLGQVRPQC